MDDPLENCTAHTDYSDFLSNSSGTEQFNKVNNTSYYWQVIIMLILVFGFVANAIVIVGMASNKLTRKKTTKYFLISLAVGDLLMMGVGGPLKVYRALSSQYTKASCVVARMAELISAFSSVLNLLAITIERFFAIVYPFGNLRWSTKNNIVKAVFLVWLLSILLSAPELAAEHYSERPTYTYCNPTLSFAVYQLVTIFIIPMIILTICYARVIYELWHGPTSFPAPANGVSGSVYKRIFGNKSNRRSILSLRTGHSRNGPQNYCMVDINVQAYPPGEQNTDEYQHRSVPPLKSPDCMVNNKIENRKQVIKMLIIVVTLFFFCWGPHLVMDILQKAVRMEFSMARVDIRNVCDILIYLHSCINPFIYFFMTKEFSGEGGCLEKMCFKKFPASESPASRQTQHSAIQRSGHESNRCSRRHNSFISSDVTRNTELESIVHIPTASSTTSNVTICASVHHSNFC